MRSAFPVLALLFAVCCFPGCGKRETPVEEGIRTKTLLVGNQNEPATLDPHLMDAATDMNVVVALFEGLTAYDEKTGGPVPGVAARWDRSPDGGAKRRQLRAAGCRALPCGAHALRAGGARGRLGNGEYSK